MQLTELTNRILPIVQNSDEYVLSHQMQFLFLLAPLKKTVGIILKRLYTDKEITTTLTKRSLKKLILDTCQKAAFSFDGKMYEQIDGVSMGLFLEPVLANIIMTECERGTVNKVLQTSCPVDVLKIRSCRRPVDVPDQDFSIFVFPIENKKDL